MGTKLGIVVPEAGLCRVSADALSTIYPYLVKSSIISSGRSSPSRVNVISHSYVTKNNIKRQSRKH